ncbi:MAG TPA: hypothetical protein VF017_08320 [Thermoanaerobaculia bacterium]|nr:hypothetical protein [Thermoanaerobaculia bacterium]
MNRSPLALLALLCLTLAACRPTREARQAEHYRVAGTATLEVEGELTLSGRFEARYALGDAVRVGSERVRELRISPLRTWLDDHDVVIPRIGRDRVLPLRCTELASNGPMAGLVDARGGLVVPAGAASVFGLAFERRAESGGCPGAGRILSFRGSSDRAITGRHDPAGNRFEVEGRFEVTIDEEEYHGRLTLDGTYLNRPPQAVIGSIAPPLFDLSQGGCPPLTGRNPDGVDSNNPEGLRMVLQSVSHDPDGDFPRADLAREQWAHYTGNPADPAAPYELLGRGRRVGPILFEHGRSHTVILGVSDRQDARAEARCTFFVRPPVR